MVSNSTIVRAFSTPTVATITGIPPGTLNHWVSIGLVKPSVRSSAGKRATRWWSVTDLIAVKAIRALRTAGCPLSLVRRVKALIEKEGDEFGERVLCWAGNDILVV